jgi:hypothetical protein
MIKHLDNMKRTIQSILSIVSLFSVMLLALASCSSSNSDREYEDVKIVGAKINGTLYLPSYDGTNTIIVLPSGTDLSNLQVQLLVANGSASDFVENGYYDCRKPMDVTLSGSNGSTVAGKLLIQSPPKLSNFYIEGVDVPSGNIFTTGKSIIVQVDKGTDLTALKVSLEFVNGTLVDFENAVARDYTSPISFNVLGVDGTTTYPYTLSITTDPVGPAFIKAMTINGQTTTKVVTSSSNVITPYVASLTDFSNADVTLQTGYGNVVDEAFTGKGLNLLSGANKVKVTGTNGVVTEFTIGRPQLDPEQTLVKAYADFGFAANDMSAVGISGNYLLVSNYTAGTKAPSYYDLTGAKQGQLSTTGCTGISYGFRKFAVDDDGVVIGSSLGLSANEQWIYKWGSLTADPSTYLSFSKASLGVAYSPRAAGINVSGSLAGTATVVMPMAQQTDVMVWTVSGGTASTPAKYTSPVKFGYYASVQPIPDGKGFILASASSALNGLIYLNANFQEQFRITGTPCTDCDVVKYSGRIYLAYTAHSGSVATMRICDITDGLEASLQNPIFSMTMKDEATNANVTTDAAFRLIGGKLYVAFTSTNADLYLLKLVQ